LPSERRRFFELLLKTKAKGVLILSGDRHFAEITKVEKAVTKLAYDLFDVTASSLNQALPPHSICPNLQRVGGPFTAANFGMLRIDWDRPRPRLTVDLRDQDGQPKFEIPLWLDELGGK
jgi:alkaline phosphatase D